MSTSLTGQQTIKLMDALSTCPASLTDDGRVNFEVDKIVDIANGFVGYKSWDELPKHEQEGYEIEAAAYAKDFPG